MTRVASVELCKELYALSRWGERYKYENLEIWGIAENGKASVITSESLAGFPFVELIPAYDLGYLLRKLPKELPKGSQSLQLVHDDDRGKDTKGWVCGYLNFDEEAYYDTAAEAGTPEDAAAKLAIALHKQGLLE